MLARKPSRKHRKTQRTKNLAPTLHVLLDIIEEGDMTVKEAAELAGIYPQEVYQWFRGYTNVNVTKLERLFDCLGYELEVMKKQ